MAAWQKPARELVETLDAALLGCDCERRVMFGGPAYFADGAMFAGVHQQSLFVRLSPDDRGDLVEEYDEAAPFEPMEGRPMREYMVLPEAVWADRGALSAWLARGRAYAASLPPKQKKARRDA